MIYRDGLPVYIRVTLLYVSTACALIFLIISQLESQALVASELDQLERAVIHHNDRACLELGYTKLDG